MTAIADHIKDIIGGAGVLVSLGIGVRNWRTTTELRKGTISLEEFRSQIRDPLVAKLNGINALKEALYALGKPNALSDDELLEQIAAQQAKLEFLMLDLDDLLKHADASNFVKTAQWHDAFDQRLQAIPASLEAAPFAAPVDRQAVSQALNNVVRQIGDLNGAIKIRLEAEVHVTMPR